MGKNGQIRRAKSKRRIDTCKRVTSLILDYLTGELDHVTARSFEEHLMICPDCVSFLNSYKKTVEFTRSLHYQDIPTEMKKRLRQFLREKIK
jgi:hypothetical protein